MTLRTFPSALALGVLLIPSLAHAAQPAEVSANDFVNLFEQLSGKQPGYRKAHARGVCATGTFAPEAAAGFESAQLLTSGTLDASVRFSVGGGRPDADERQPGVRGMGLQLSDGAGLNHVFTGNNFPVFAGKDPATFFGLLKANLPGPDGKPNPEAIQQYIAEHPSVQANVAWRQSIKTTASYGNTHFYGLHTFYYGDGDQATKFRWELVPEAGEAFLDAEEAASKANGFLEARLKQQISTDGVSYRLEAVLGQPQDSINDPSVQWPAERERVVLGRLTLTSAGGQLCDSVNYDPNRISRGFRASDDPVLRMRSVAYAISFGKRLSNQ